MPARGAHAARIPNIEGFDACLKSPPLWRRGVFAFHVRFVDAPVWRLGLVIPKRFERSAVARNAIKRRWRQAFRLQRAGWAARFGGGDLVVRMTAPLVAVKVRRAATQTKRRVPAVAQVPAVAPMTARQRAAFDATGLIAGVAERLVQRRAPGGERSLAGKRP